MDAMSTYFWIVPDTLGQIPFEVSAVSGLAADAVRRLLLVEASNLQLMGHSLRPRPCAGNNNVVYLSSERECAVNE